MAGEAGITFCFAPVFHPAMRHAGGAPARARRAPPSFNFLGPLTNPAQPAAQAIGCADPRMAGVMAEVFARRGVAALVVRGDDGLDELTTATTSTVWRVREGAVTEHVLDPARLGVPVSPASALRGGDAATTPPWCAGCWPANRGRSATPCCSTPRPRWSRSATRWAGPDDLDEAMAGALVTAAAAVDSGAAAGALERWVAASAALAPSTD